MNTHDKAPAGATNTDQGNENLCTGISTTDPTPKPRINPKTGKPKRRTWHLNAGTTDDGRAKGLCGWVSRPAPLTAPSTSLPAEANIITVKCPDCAEIVRMQQAAVRRRQRAEKIAAYVEDILERHERGEL